MKNRLKGIVDLHGGQVHAASAGPGCGSEFTLRLPLDRAPRNKPGPDESKTVSGSSNKNTPSRLWRILIIEDNPVAARSAQLVLERMGHTVAVAHSGTEGLEVALKSSPEVVLCNIGLPGLDGYDVAELFRKQIKLEKVYLIAISGYAQDESRARAAGFDAYLIKPVNFTKMGQMLAGLDAPRRE